MTHSGKDFAICGMHFKIGLYEHQSAGALEGLVQLLVKEPSVVKGGADGIERINIVAYEPAFGIIGDPAKKDPKTRQSADHSMAFILSRMLQKAIEKGSVPTSNQDAWKTLMLTPQDFGLDALFNKETRALMSKITFDHGGPDYDSRYPDGIPTSIDIFLKGGKKLSSGMVMYPPGHARNTTADLKDLLKTKNKMLGDIVFEDISSYERFLNPLIAIKGLKASQLEDIYNFDWSKMCQHPCIDGARPVQRSKL